MTIDTQELRDLATDPNAYRSDLMVNLDLAACALDAQAAEIEQLNDVLRRNGFVRCDTSICNCGSWHARYGWPERMHEIQDALSEAGHPLCNENGNQPLNALAALVSERDAMGKALNLLVEKADESDNSYYGTLSTTLVRIIVRAALSGDATDGSCATTGIIAYTKLLESKLFVAANYIDTLGGDSKAFRAALSQGEPK